MKRTIMRASLSWALFGGVSAEASLITGIGIVNRSSANTATDTGTRQRVTVTASFRPAADTAVPEPSTSALGIVGSALCTMGLWPRQGRSASCRG